MKKDLVSVEKCNDYSSKKVRGALIKSLKNINFDLSKLKRKVVLIKPNLLSPAKPEVGITTHPMMVEELCKLLKEVKVKKIIIGDSSAYNTDATIKLSGIGKLEKYAEIINFESQKKKFFDFKIPGLDEKVPLPNILFDVDFIINFAKLKTHGLTQVTLCTKNLYGCVPGKVKEEIHKHLPSAKNFSKLLHKLALEIKPGLNFVDGVVGIEGEGPGASGKIVKSNLLFASESVGAVDFIASDKMGFSPMQIYTNKYSGVKQKQIGVVGSGKDVKMKFEKPSTHLIPGFFWLSKFIPKGKIIADENKCRRCGICVKKCPVNALELKPYAKCDHKICIHCLCCVEVCPYDAIKLEEPWIKRFLMNVVKKMRKV